MTTSFDELVEHLTSHVAFAGSHGVGPQDLRKAAIEYFARQKKTSDQNPNLINPSASEHGLLFSYAPPPREMVVDNALVQTLWNCISAFPEVTVKDKLAFGAANETSNDEDEFLSLSGKRLHASESRMWLAITGHGVDLSRVSRLEFEALSVIASRGAAGIMQPELVRVTGQDKRSLPKRTDALASKGYITKENVIAKGTRTSVLRLKRFASDNPTADVTTPNSEKPFKFMNELEAWFDKTISLLTSQAGWLIAYTDLRRELGIEGQPYETKSYHRCIRRLDNVGCIARFTAMEAEQTGKKIKAVRCIKLLRTPTPNDQVAWIKVVNSLNHSSSTLEGRHEDDPVETDDELDEENALQNTSTADHIGSRWRPDLPAANIVFRLADQAGPNGISSMELQKQISPFWRKPLDELLSRLTDHWQISQPAHLRHLTIIRDTALTNTSTHFLYRTYSNFEAAVDQGITEWAAIKIDHGENNKIKNQSHSPKLDEWGFPVLEAGQAPQVQVVKRGPIGRPRKNKTSTHFIDDTADTPTGKRNLDAAAKREQTERREFLKTATKVSKNRLRLEGQYGSNKEGEKEQMQNRLEQLRDEYVAMDKPGVFINPPGAAHEKITKLRLIGRPPKACIAVIKLDRFKALAALQSMRDTEEQRARSVGNDVHEPLQTIAPINRRRSKVITIHAHTSDDLDRGQGSPPACVTDGAIISTTDDLPHQQQDKHKDLSVDKTITNTLSESGFAEETRQTSHDVPVQDERSGHISTDTSMIQSHSVSRSKISSPSAPYNPTEDLAKHLRPDSMAKPKRIQPIKKGPLRARQLRPVQLADKISRGNVSTTDQALGTPQNKSYVVGNFDRANATPSKAPAATGIVYLRRTQIIMDTIKRCGGVFPGNNAMWYPFASAWEKMYGHRPDRQTVENTVKNLIGSRRLNKIRFHFTSRTERSETGSILTFPEVDKNAAEVKAVREKIIEHHPAKYVPEEVDVLPDLRTKLANFPRPIDHTKKDGKRQHRESTDGDVASPYKVRNGFPRSSELVVRRVFEVEDEENEPATPPPKKRPGPKERKRRLTDEDRPEQTRGTKKAKADSNPDVMEQEFTLLPTEPRPAEAIMYNTGPQEANTAQMVEQRPDRQRKDENPTTHPGRITSIPSSLAFLSNTRPMQTLAKNQVSETLAMIEPPVMIQPPLVMDPPARVNVPNIMIPSVVADPPVLIDPRIELVPPVMAKRKPGRKPRPRLPPEMLALMMVPFQEFHALSGTFGTNNIWKTRRKRGQRLHASVPNIEIDGPRIAPRPAATEDSSKHFDSRVTEPLEQSLLTTIESNDRRKRRKVSRRVAFDATEIEDEDDGAQVRTRQRRIRKKDPEFDVDRLLVSCAIVRLLCAGIGQRVLTWDIVAHCFHFRYDSDFVRSQWVGLRPDQKESANALQEAIREQILVAYESGGLPSVDFTDLGATDWPALVDWAQTEIFPEHKADSSTMSQLPASRKQLDLRYEVKQSQNPYEATPDEFFGAAVNIHRHDIAHRQIHGVVIPSDEDVNSTASLVLLKTWCRAVVMASERGYNSAFAARKITAVFKPTDIERANDELLAENYFTSEKKGRQLPGRNFYLTAHVLKQFRRWPSPEDTYLALVAHAREQILQHFQTYTEYNLTMHTHDPSMAVLTNLVGQGQLRVRVELPPRNDDPDATEPRLSKWGPSLSDYTMKRKDSSHRRFPVVYELVPDCFTTSHGLRPAPIPRGPHGLFPGEADLRIPFWMDIQGNLLVDAWEMTIRSILHLLVFRPGCSVAAIENAHRKVLAAWEIELVLEWMSAVGLARHCDESQEGLKNGKWMGGWKASEWWYCAWVPEIVNWR